jgi:hypothetical protein
MKNSYKAALLVALGLAAVSSAQAQVNNNDIILNFSSPTTTNVDYTIDLGQIEAVPTTPINLSSDINATTLNSLFTSIASLNVGVVGGSYNVPGQGDDIYISGLSLPTHASSENTITFAAESALGISPGTNPSSANSSFSTLVAASPTATGLAGSSSVQGYLGGSSQTQDNPMINIGSSDMLTFNLYEEVKSSATHPAAFTYQGQFVLDLSGSSPSLVFDPVPEPSTYALASVGGLLFAFFRRRSSCS